MILAQRRREDSFEKTKGEGLIIGHGTAFERNPVAAFYQIPSGVSSSFEQEAIRFRLPGFLLGQWRIQLSRHRPFHDGHIGFRVHSSRGQKGTKKRQMKSEAVGSVGGDHSAVPATRASSRVCLP